MSEPADTGLPSAAVTARRPARTSEVGEGSPESLSGHRHRVGSLFSGIGGFDLAFERAGFEVAFQCEIDKHASAVLAHHWPGVRRIEDVKHVTATAGPIDVLVGGFPCQDLSVAGRRAGLAGERSGLFFEFARCIEALAPEWVVIENVPGLLSSQGGRDMATVVGTLGELGYGWAYRVLDAQHFGLAQRRRRVFIVGCSGGRTRRAAEVLFEPESVCGDSPPRRTAGKGLAGTLGGGSSGERGWRNDLDGSGAYVVQERAVNDNPTSGPQGKGWQYEQSFTLESRPHPQVVSPTLRAEYGEKAYRGDGSDPLIFEPRYVRNGRGAPGVIAPPLKAENGNTGKGDGAPLVLNVEHALAPHGAFTGGLPELGASEHKGHSIAYIPPIVPQAMSSKWAKQSSGPAGDEVATMFATSDSVRRLTPKECERLQGFPDDWTAGQAGQADSHRYHQLGNAVAVLVVEWIARRMAAVPMRGEQ